MKFNCGKSEEAKLEDELLERKRLSNYHLWFAWYPVRVGNNDCRWLERVLRKGKFVPSSYSLDSAFWIWTYFPSDYDIEGHDGY